MLMLQAFHTRKLQTIMFVHEVFIPIFHHPNRRIYLLHPKFPLQQQDLILGQFRSAATFSASKNSGFAVDTV